MTFALHVNSQNENRSRKSGKRYLSCATFVVFSSLVTIAQQRPATMDLPPDPDRAEISGGFAYLNPSDSGYQSYTPRPMNSGATLATSFYFDRYIGVRLQSSFYPTGPHDCFYTADAGPSVRYPRGRWTPYGFAVAGGRRLGGPLTQSCAWGWGFSAGAGIDYILPFLHGRLAIQAVQAEFDYSRLSFTSPPASMVSGGLLELSTGLVVRLGHAGVSPELILGCDVSPSNVFPGDPVTVTAVANNLKIGKKTSYQWSTSGGVLAAVGEVANVQTVGLNPGDYLVSGHVSQGLRPNQKGACKAGFRVHAFEAPTVSCTANPETVQVGQPSTITSTARSPQNRILKYSYLATAGQVGEPLPTTSLLTEGVNPGKITVSCEVVDDLGQKASSQVDVSVLAPSPQTVRKPLPLCSLSFTRDTLRPVRVDNGAKACLDEVALALNRDADAKMVLLGRHSSDETSSEAAQRVLNAEQYLTEEKGIDPARLEVRTGGALGRAVDDILLPLGVEYLPADSLTVDSTTVKRSGEAYGKQQR